MAINDGLALSDEQRDLQTMLRGFLQDKLTSRALRDSIASDDGFDRQLWSRLAGELGLGGLTIPEEYGGLGLGPAEAAVVHEELGRALYPGPFLAAGLAVTALLASQDTSLQRTLLPRIATGACIATVAVVNPRAIRNSLPPAVTARLTAGQWQLDGTLDFVPAGHVADAVLIPVGTPEGPSLFLVEAGADGFGTAAMPGLDLTRKLAAVTLEQTPATLVGQEGEAGPAVWAVRNALLLATACEAAGGIDWCLTTGVDYAKTREQFGRPIGSFQAVAHTCVDILAQLEFTRAAARYAAVATAQADPEAALATQVAALRSGEAYRTVTEATIHLLGGTGFTWEHDAHLYYRRAWSGQQLAGGPRGHREAIAALAGM